ncbi:MAG TPA: polyphosphate polymerase domain-containing protein [bacterium]|nr:polyphosphate polymerase domain-containing protein [bacterium]HPR88903.1 polyphosphate polymerase domain-containing protein [bacterium]
MLRYEFKYLIPCRRIDALRRRLMPFVQEDKFARRMADHQYTVRSVYYENRTFRCYHDKLAGVERRFKLRIRGYNQPLPGSYVFLEVKRKNGVFIGKNRAPVPWQELPLLLSDHDIERHILEKRGFEEGRNDARQFFYHLVAHAMQPAILIVYEREAFFATFDRRIRLTFDKNIRFRPAATADLLFEEHKLAPLHRDHFVFELKFHDSLPEWLMDIVSEFALQRMAISKYTLSLDKAQRSHPFIHQIAGTGDARPALLRMSTRGFHDPAALLREA